MTPDAFAVNYHVCAGADWSLEKFSKLPMLKLK